MTAAPTTSAPFIIRRYTPEDRPALLALHEKHGTEFWFADPDDPVNFETWVLEEDGKIISTVTARCTAEAFFMIDKTHGSPADRWRVAQEMLEFSANRANELGLREVHIGVGGNQRGWLRRLLSLPSMFLDSRERVIMGVWHRFRGGAK